MHLKTTVAALLAVWAVWASAEPISFTTTQFMTTTAAVSEGSGGLVDAHNDVSPPSATPLFTESTVISATDTAFGTAIAAPGSLTTSAEAISLSGFSDAVGNAEFVGSFTALRPFVTLSLDFTTIDGADPSALSSGSVFVQLTSGASTLFNETFTLSGPIERTTAIPLGAPGTLDIFLSSSATTLQGGDAFNSATVTFSAAFSPAAVPEPATLFLLGPGFVSFAWFRRRRGELAYSSNPACGVG